MIPDTLLRLAINRLSVLRPNEKLVLEEIVDSEALFRSLTPALLSQIVGRSIPAMNLCADDLLAHAERDARFLRSRACRVVSVRDRSYPSRLREIFDPPYLLYVRGSVPTSDSPAVAIVGTRRPTATAVLAARSFGADLARAGVPVVSGLARGIDVAAHQGALQYGVTGAILASGVDLITPSGHKGVAAAILDSGGYLASEYAPGVPPAKYHFPARNRIISGLARGVVVVQAPARSGALITADYALDQGRDLFVHRDGLEPPVGAGTAELAADGALIVSGAADVFNEWGLETVGETGGDDRARTTAVPRCTVEAAAARVDEIRRTLSGGREA
ncbi:MAG: DNA-processing protein DprA [Spirochaetota bacterium]